MFLSRPDLQSSPWLASLSPQRVFLVTDAVMKKLAGVENVGKVDVVAELRMPAWTDFITRGRPVERLLALDGVQDPGNMGTLVRTALALGWDGVFLLPGCCDPFNDKALRASRGSALRLPLMRGNWGDLEQVVGTHQLRWLAACPEGEPLVPGQTDPGPWVLQEEVPVLTAELGHNKDNGPGRLGGRESLEGKPSPPGGAAFEQANGKGSAAWVQEEQAEVRDGAVDSQGPCRAVCLVLGSEGQGLSSEALGRCQPVSVPMLGAMESLNVAVAGGILMFMMGEEVGKLWREIHGGRRVG